MPDDCSDVIPVRSDAKPVVFHVEIRKNKVDNKRKMKRMKRTRKKGWK
jgi:hypothetical protein